MNEMSRSENRHYTIKWKQRRKKKLADKCGKPQCTICHCDKVLGIPDRQQRRAKDEIKVQIMPDQLNNEEWEKAHEIFRLSMFED